MKSCGQNKFNRLVSSFWGILLLRFDQGERVAESLVLDDGSVVHTLEDPIGKRDSFPSHLEGSVCDVI
jgi:hypothetical protein